MGAIKLEPLSATKVPNGLSIDPKPDWSFRDLLSELTSLESKLNSSPIPFTKSPSREISASGRRENGQKKGFVMGLSDSDFDDDDEEEEEEDDRKLELAGRFACDEIYLSDSDDDAEDDSKQLQVLPFMDKMGVVEGAFHEVTHDYHLAFKDEIRTQISALETQLVAEKEKSTSSLLQVEKNTEARRVMDRKLDLHYQRKIAEGLDNHLTAIQRDHEQRSQIEERRIRNDAAIEEAKRKEKALQEEKLRQQKARADEEARHEAAKRAEVERKATEEAERKAKEAADKERENSAKQVGTTASALPNVPSPVPAPVVPREVRPAGAIRAADDALKLEQSRLAKYSEIEERNRLIISSSNKDVRPKEREIGRRIKQISGSIESVREKANDLVKIFSDPEYPQSVTVAMFAKKVISISETPTSNFNSSAYACGHVIVYVSSQVQGVMDCLLAEFHKACCYTVPKHLVFSRSAYSTREDYFKAIGFREEEGKLETMDDYLKRLALYMKLYGAIVQTEAQGVQNLHGLEEGWKWLARFVRTLPANIFTGVALEAFLRMAGFGLYRKYKGQFLKILKAITREFLPSLRARQDANIGPVVTVLQNYIESNQFLEEPEGWRLKSSLLSRDMTPFQESSHYGNSYHRY